MQRCHGPSWLAMGPSHPGESKWGKLSADQWRSFCSIHLVITLIRLWGSFPPESHEHQRLVNFMHLQAAVTLATARYMTPARIDLYEGHMEAYLVSLLELYPGTSITPYQHLSLHYGPTLRGFGPTHGYRCWPFERNNYRLQQIPTNKKFGDMEITMLNRFCMSQNLRTLMRKSQLPTGPGIDPLLVDFENTFNSGEQGTLLNDSLALDDATRTVTEVQDWDERHEKTLLKGKMRTLLIQWFIKNQNRAEDSLQILHIFYRSELLLTGQKFQPNKANTGNSKVVFYADVDKGTKQWSAGCIREIFSVSLSPNVAKTFAFVDVYAQVEGADAKLDYYRQFPIGGGGLFYNQMSGAVLLPAEDILGHFVYTVQTLASITKEHFHALPLPRVIPFR
ncbi:hypothetical protein C8R43DRAFT_955157 [Mycena crocata]|nr:hypothetical protein C8R43DRAFT_955157 [Mycena crocata]